jgi:NAD+ kinase
LLIAAWMLACNAGVMITLRMRLCCEIFRRGYDQPEQVHEVLNEVVIDRGSSSFLTNIECYVQGRFVTRVQADGVMLATPTGKACVQSCQLAAAI